MLRTVTTTAAALTLLLSAQAASAEEHIVEMLNRDKESKQAMVFKPAVLKIAPGDTVIFKATNKGHNAESIDGLIPEGAEPFKGKINQEISVTFDVEGAYAYRCAPHYATGMIGLIIVGDSTEGLDKIASERFPGRSKQRRDEYVEIARGLSS